MWEEIYIFLKDIADLNECVPLVLFDIIHYWYNLIGLFRLQKIIKTM